AQVALLGAKRVSVWRPHTQERTHALVLPWSAQTIAFAPDGRHLLLGERGTKYVLRLRPFDETGAILARCDAVLKERPGDVPALVCRAQAHLARGSGEAAL